MPSTTFLPCRASARIWSAPGVERSGSTNSRSTPIAAGFAAAMPPINSATTVRGHGHWPLRSSAAASISTMTAGALERLRGMSRW